MYEARLTPVYDRGVSSANTLVEFANMTWGDTVLIIYPNLQEAQGVVTEVRILGETILGELRGQIPNVDLTIEGDYRFRVSNGSASLEYPLAVKRQGGEGVERPKSIGEMNLRGMPGGGLEEEIQLSQQFSYCEKLGAWARTWPDEWQLTRQDSRDGPLIKAMKRVEMKPRAFNGVNWEESAEYHTTHKLAFSVYGRSLTYPTQIYTLVVAFDAQDFVAYCASNPLLGNAAISRPEVGIWRSDENRAYNWQTSGANPSRLDAPGGADQKGRVAAGFLADFIATIPTYGWAVGTGLKYLSSESHWPAYEAGLWQVDGRYKDVLVWKSTFDDPNTGSVDILQNFNWPYGETRDIQFYGAIRAAIWLYESGGPQFRGYVWVESSHKVNVRLATPP